MTALALRAYQSEAIERTLAAADRGVRRQLGVAATGLGKTIVFASLARQMGCRTLVLAHRDELVSQAVDKIRGQWPEASVGIVKAELNQRDRDVVVASVQTLARPKRLEQFISAPGSFFGPNLFGLVIVDEAHHARAETYQTILAALGAGQPDGPLLLGVTATPDRGDGKGLDDVFDEVTWTYDILWGIRSGFLCDLRGRRVTIDTLDLKGVKVRNGDFAEGETGARMMDAGAPEAIYRAWSQHAADRRTLVFTPTVETAEATCAEFIAGGISAAVVSAKTPLEERRQMLRDFSTGVVQVMCNCMVLCLDEETEILTDRGWVGPDEMTYSHRVANWDQGRVHFVEPQEIVVRPRGESEAMYRLETTHRSVRVTSRHRMLYRTTDRGQWLKAPVDDLAGRAVDLPTCGIADPFAVGPADEVPLTDRRRRRIISAAAYNLRNREGFGWDESVIEATRRTDRRYGLRRTPPSKLTLAECRLIGFWIGDGSRTELATGGVEYSLSQAKVYPRIIEWVDQQIAECGLDCARREISRIGGIPHVRWGFARGTGGGSQERRGVYGLEPYLDKNGSPWLWGLNEEQFEALVIGWWYADGYHGQAESVPRSLHISSSFRSLLDTIQAIAVVRGWTASVTSAGAPKKDNHAQLWKLVLSRRQSHRMGGSNPDWRIQREEEPWKSERVWCVKTDTKNIVTRRRGTVTVMGNTEGFDEPRVDCVIVARPTKSRALYTQMVGRGTRRHPDKADLLVLDVVGVSDVHSLVTVPSLFGVEQREFEQKLADGDGLVTEVLNEIEQEMVRAGQLKAAEADLFKQMRSTIVWVQAHTDGSPLRRYERSTGRDRDGTQRPTVRLSQLYTGEDRWTCSLMVSTQKGSDLKALIADVPLETAHGVGEDWLRKSGAMALVAADAPWRAGEPSEKQVAFARRLGIDPAGLSKGDLSNAINAAMLQRKQRGGSYRR